MPGRERRAARESAPSLSPTQWNNSFRSTGLSVVFVLLFLYLARSQFLLMCTPCSPAFPSVLNLSHSRSSTQLHLFVHQSIFLLRRLSVSRSLCLPVSSGTSASTGMGRRRLNTLISRVSLQRRTYTVSRKCFSEQANETVIRLSTRSSVSDQNGSAEVSPERNDQKRETFTSENDKNIHTPRNSKYLPTRG